MNVEWIKKRIIWDYRFLKIQLGFERKSINSYYGKKVQNKEETNEYIGNAILNSYPIFVGRIGGTELRTIVTHQRENISKRGRKGAEKDICELSGFFYKDINEVYKFVTLMQESCREIDMIGTWSNYMEDYIINKYCTDNVKLTRLSWIEPWYSSNNPWSKYLKGKKVVVVHPFKETILLQYGKRDKIYPGTDILPKFDLRVVKAVQTIADEKDNRFENWFQALEYMYDEVMKEEFDIAIVGCGAYGFPLAAKLKKEGKQVIQLAGATQLLFGIKGKRWDERDEIKKLYNENWIFPLKCDVPLGAEKVENACYWK